MVKQFIQTLKTFPSALSVLFSKQFRWYSIIPILLIILLFYGGDLIVSTLADRITERAKMYMDTLDFENSMLEQGGMLVIKLAVKIIYMYVFLVIGGYVVLLIMSPVLSLLSEQYEEQLIGERKKFRLKVFVRETIRGIFVAVRNCFLQGMLMGILFFLSFVPMFGLITPILMFFVTAYFYGFTFVDYVVERKGISIGQGMQFINQNMGLVLGLGIPFTLALTFPFIRIVVCSYLSLISVIIATSILNKSQLNNDLKIYQS